MTDLSKDQTIDALTRENTRLYGEVTELRERVAALEAECDELSRCLPVADEFVVDI